ncbi:MAG TPA: hypothetical protein VFR74_02710, partial [Jiangellales bacterium]|nr:hypothetical protein [Jiangellales bacterium]
MASEWSVLAGLLLLTLALGLALHYLGDVPVAVLVLPLLVALVALPLRGVVVVVIAVGIALAYEGIQNMFEPRFLAAGLV